MPNSKLPAVTEAELAILERLWETAPQTARGLTASLYPAQTPSEIATVQKLIHRLEGKGLVARDRERRIHEFRPLVSREAYAGERLADLADRLAEGSVAPMLLHLVNSRKLEARELAELRAILDEATPPVGQVSQPDAPTRKGQS